MQHSFTTKEAKPLMISLNAIMSQINKPSFPVLMHTLFFASLNTNTLQMQPKSFEYEEKATPHSHSKNVGSISCHVGTTPDILISSHPVFTFSTSRSDSSLCIMTILIDSNIGPISNSLLLYTLIVYAFAFVCVYLI